MDILSTQEDEDLARAVALSLGEAGDTKESTSNSAPAPKEQLDKIKMDQDASRWMKMGIPNISQPPTP